MIYNKKMYKTKSKMRKTYIFILIMIVCYLWFEKDITKFNQDALVETKQEIKIPIEVSNSHDPNIKKLVTLSSKYPDINTILKNVNLYPKELLELAAKKPRTIEFVLDYPKYKSSSGNKAISIKNDYTKGKILLFIQWDKRWGYEKCGQEFIAISGCGPTALSMVIVGLTENTTINPKVVADFSYKNGYFVEGQGSSWTLMTEGAKHYGLKSKELPLSKSVILSTLRNNQPIIAVMGPGKFTTEGHFIVLKGVTEDGKITINDSDSKVNSNKEWDLEVFMKETRNLWTYSI